VFERSVQRELVRCDLGKLVLGVHWSHRLAPENVLWSAPHLQESGTGAFGNLRIRSRNWSCSQSRLPCVFRFIHSFRIRSENMRTIRDARPGDSPWVHSLGGRSGGDRVRRERQDRCA
jgi:hypothetical protein